MTDTNKDFLAFTGEGTPQLSGGLKVITVLTIIWSVILAGLGVLGYVNAKKNYEELKKLMSSGDLEKAPAWAKRFMNEESLEFSRKMLENKMPILIISLAGAALCLYGALEMRKLRKQGYILWLAGELLPIIGMFFLVGGGYFSGFNAIGLVFPLIFIILYTVYRKDLVY